MDREKKSSYLFLVEARDSSGLGSSNYSQLLITVLGERRAGINLSFNDHSINILAIIKLTK